MFRVTVVKVDDLNTCIIPIPKMTLSLYLIKPTDTGIERRIPADDYAVSPPQCKI